MARLCARSVIFLLWISTTFFGETQAQWCYYPGGQDKALQDYPCDPYAYTTLCCPLGWTCFSNNLCVVTDESAVGSAFPVGTALRGTCTNPSWNDTACGGFCLENTRSSSSGALQSCGGGNWCCQSSADAGTCDCATGQGTFYIPDGEAQTIIGVQGLGTTSTDSQMTSTASSAFQTTSSRRPSTTSKISETSSAPTSRSSSSAKSKSSSMQPSSTPSSTHTSPPPTSHTSSSTTSAAAAAAATSTHHSLPITKTTGFKAGIAIASIFAVLLILAICLWFIWYRRRRRNERNIGGAADADPNVYTPGPVPGPMLRSSTDAYGFPYPEEGRGAKDGVRLLPVSERSEMGERGSGSWSGGYGGGFVGRSTAERMVGDWQAPYEGT